MRPVQRSARFAILGMLVGLPLVLASRAGAAAPDKKTHGSVATKVTPTRAAARSRSRVTGKPHHKPSGRPTREGGGPTEIASIHDGVSITPFPSQAAAAAKALAQNRRDELQDAERAARAPDQPDRWQTVLFDLRNLDARSDPEGCFWRVVAYYRLGQVERARSTRALCDLPAKDQAIIEAEDALSASAQPPTALAEETHPDPVPNPSPYASAGPTPFNR